MSANPKGSTAPLPERVSDHPGERVMRERLPSRFSWNEFSLPSMMRPSLSIGLARFIEQQPFFFIATADEQGHCDCSFRGREVTASGEPLPALKVMDARTLIFPDFSGNGLYNSLGNMVVNPHVGMLFVDFGRQARARVNGIARIMEASPEILAIWPLAQAAVQVEVEQAYGNCGARIPRLMEVT